MVATVQSGVVKGRLSKRTTSGGSSCVCQSSFQCYGGGRNCERAYTSGEMLVFGTLVHLLNRTYGNETARSTMNQDERVLRLLIRTCSHHLAVVGDQLARLQSAGHENVGLTVVAS